MAIINSGIGGCVFTRKKGCEGFERQLRSLSGLTNIRERCFTSPAFKQEVEQSLQPVSEDLGRLITKCDLNGKNFKIISKPVEGWQLSVDQVLNSIDPKIVTFGSEPNHTQLSKCEDLMSFFQKTIILNDPYVTIFINPLKITFQKF